MVLNSKSPLNVAVGNLALKSWESWETRNLYCDGYRQNLKPSRPGFVVQLLEQRKTSSMNLSSGSSGGAASRSLDANPLVSHETSAVMDWNFGSSSIADPLAPMDWNYWNDLMQGTETNNAFAPQQNDWAAFER